MIINIRDGVFETNSSSTHSFIMSKKKLIEEFVLGKHKINLITQQIVENGHENEAIELNKIILNKYIEFNFNKEKTAKYFNIAENYEMGESLDSCHKQLNNNSIKNINANISYKQFRAALTLDAGFRDIVIDHCAKMSLITFDEMDTDCEIRYGKSDFYKDPNGEIYSAIFICGSDSQNTGAWPAV